MNRRDFLKLISKGATVGAVAATVGVPTVAEINDKSVLYLGEQDALREASNSLDNLATSAGKASESVYVFNGSLSQVKISQELIDDSVTFETTFRSIFIEEFQKEFQKEHTEFEKLILFGTGSGIPKGIINS